MLLALIQICVDLYSSLSQACADCGFTGEPLTLLDCRTVCAACSSITARMP